MTKNSRDQKKLLKKTMASGLVVSVLLLTVLPGCTARHMPDWSRVQAVSPQTKTHVRLYSNQKVRGRFHSAADDSLTLTLRDGQQRTLPKQSVHKVAHPSRLVGRVARVDCGGGNRLIGRLGLHSYPRGNNPLCRNRWGDRGSNLLPLPNGRDLQRAVPAPDAAAKSHATGCREESYRQAEGSPVT